MDVDHEKVTALSLTIAFGGLCNILLLVSLVLTWRYWRQVKWYIVTLLVANALELAFRFGMELGWHLTGSWRGGPEASCKFFMAMRMVGPCLAHMALAALAVHVLLTALTGSQGEGRRHGLVLGLFVLLSLPLPLTQIPMYRLLSLPYSPHSRQCVSFDFFQSEEEVYYFLLGHVIAVLYFPLLVYVVCLVIAGFLTYGRKGNVKGDEHISDLYIASVLGVVVVVCSLPISTYNVVIANHFTPNVVKVFEGLLYLEHCRNPLSALFTAAFSFLYVYRNRHDIHLLPATTSTNNANNGERQKLVN